MGILTDSYECYDRHGNMMRRRFLATPEFYVPGSTTCLDENKKFGKDG